MCFGRMRAARFERVMDKSRGRLRECRRGLVKVQFNCSRVSRILEMRAQWGQVARLEK